MRDWSKRKLIGVWVGMCASACMAMVVTWVALRIVGVMLVDHDRTTQIWNLVVSQQQAQRQAPPPAGH